MLSANELSMTPAATAAFDNFLYLLDRDGSNSIDKDELKGLVDALGWDGDFEDLWADFAKQAKSAATGVPYEEVDVAGCIQIDKDEVHALYASIAYHTEEIASRASEKIIGQLKRLFDAADEDGSGMVSGDEVRQMAGMLSKKFQFDVDPDRLLEKLDRNGDNEITFAELAAGVLSLDLPGEDDAVFEEDLLEPEKHTPEEFIASLKAFALAHQASKHRFLTDLSGGRFASISKAMLTFALEYRKYSSTFTKMLQACSDKLGDGPGAAVVKENLEEEMGDEIISKAEIKYLEKLGIPRETVEGVPHTQIFSDFVEAIRKHVDDGKPFPATSYYGASAGDKFQAAMQKCVNGPAHVGLAVLAYGAELLVPQMYQKIFRGVSLFMKLTPIETRFFPLHINCDGGHFDKLARAVKTHSATKQQRTEIFEAVSTILDARVALWDDLMSLCAEETVTKGKEVASSLYDKQASNWKRDKPNCLSDFTGRPRLFEACGDIAGKHMLDVGCGEGYCARVLRKAGVRKVVGVDVSEEMVKAAERSERKHKLGNMYYLAADALDIKSALIDNATSVGMLGGAEIDRGCFDIAIAAFLFNYVGTKPMREIMEQVFDLLVPGGAFVFSVPHPMMAGKAGLNTSGGAKFGFTSEEYSGYFSARDVLIPGEISTRDGKTLNVRMIHKTFEDYMSAIRSAGFELESLTECSVTEEHLQLDPNFFGAVSDMPLHAVFRCVRPTSATHNARNLNNLTMLPRQLMWTPVELNNPEDAFIMYCPPSVAEELYHMSVTLVQKKGVMVNDFKPEMLLASDLNITAKFGAQMRRQLMRHTGAIIIKGFDLNRVGGEGHPLLEETAKMMYYMICRSIGEVEEGSRGRLFDVKSAGLSHKADNVLFSVTDGEASWHTDGTSRDRVFDVVGLLCIRPAAKGGEFAVANACNAFAGLDSRMPRFIMYELMRHLPRDVIEKGKGKGSNAEDFVSNIARSKEMLQLRILRNAFPIYEMATDEGGTLEMDRRMRFRYMRFWVESGHLKAGIRVPPMLRIAMDFLDKELDKFCCFKAPLEAGDIVMCNNHLIAHAREGFKDGAKPRHKVRAWIQIQVADLIDEIDEKEGHALSMLKPAVASDIAALRLQNQKNSSKPVVDVSAEGAKKDADAMPKVESTPTMADATAARVEVVKTSFLKCLLSSSSEVPFELLG